MWERVREDYRLTARVEYFWHDQARSRAIAERGRLAGISTSSNSVLPSPSGLEMLPILKELSLWPDQVNEAPWRGADVKEVYYYAGSTPTHSYMKYLYNILRAAYPYGGPDRGKPYNDRATVIELMTRAFVDDDNILRFCRICKGRCRGYFDADHRGHSGLKTRYHVAVATDWFRTMTWDGSDADIGMRTLMRIMRSRTRRWPTVPLL